MAQKKQSSSKQRASGGGRTSNSEPRVQTFTQFGGCNFQLSPKDFKYSDPTDDAQSDLQMNFVVIQNNANLSPNKTIETRQPLRELLQAPKGKTFTGVSCLDKDELFMAINDGSIEYRKLGSNNSENVTITSRSGSPEHHWTCLGVAASRVIGLTKEQQMWISEESDHHTLRNAQKFPDRPLALTSKNLAAKGELVISETATDECPFRLGIQYTYVNEFGPTLASDILTFWASKPSTEWSSNAYLTITGYNVIIESTKAVEIYYLEDEFQTPNFLARVDVAYNTKWSYNWLGYLADTSMWSTANLTLPTQNHTQGVPASYFTQHDGRLYFWGNEDMPNRLWIGGNAGNVLSVSTGTGGGFVDVEPGSGQEIRMVPKYKTQSGNSIVTILCDSKNSSHEHRHNLLENNISLSSEQNVKGWQTEKVNGTVGCKSFRGAGVWADGLYAISRYGLALTTMTMEYNSQLRVQYVSDPIEPVFLEQYGRQLKNSVLLCVNDIIYMCFGKDIDGSDDNYLDNVIFCYDIDRKAWWTYTIDIDEPILNLINIDYEGSQEGIGIITPNRVCLLPTTKTDRGKLVDFLIETGELSTAIPQQNMQHLTQLEFCFDYFVGSARIEVTCIDQFGRKIETSKEITRSELDYGVHEYMRIDQRVRSYKIVIKGKASFRLTHFLAKTYPLPSKVGIVWGFDDSQGHRHNTDIHRTFKCYNDLKDAIIP